MGDEDAKDSKPTFDAVQAAAEFAAAMAESSAEPPEAPAAGKDKYTDLLEDEIESLKALVAEKDNALDAAHQRAQAATAEVARARARIETSAKADAERKRRSVLTSFLDVADALDRAVAELDKGDVAPAVAQGVRGVRSELHNVLRQHGAKHRPSRGEAFDPAHHEAIATAPATAEHPEGTILDVLSEGYELGDETLRAARVVVAK